MSLYDPVRRVNQDALEDFLNRQNDVLQGQISDIIEYLHEISGGQPGPGEGDTLTLGHGPPGSAPGAQGDEYIDLDAGAFYTFVGTTRFEERTAMGDDLFLGTGAPTVDAKYGDDYIDLANGDIYTFRED
jgi:hypothetical protein